MIEGVPVNEPLLNGNEARYLQECIATGWISSDGPFIRRFEEEFAAKVGCKHGIAVCNGSAAIDAAIAALRIGPGDEVILPTFTIISCAASIVRAGAKPVVVDGDPATWNMDVAQLEEKITPRTKAIMVVHIYGLPVEMNAVRALAAKHGLRIIEDAAQAHGQTFRGEPCGSLGDVSTFSFYPNKHVTTGEGGMITTNNSEYAERCRSVRNLCFLPGRRFVHEELGWNFRMSNLQAAIGVAQLERLDETVERKKAMGRRYTELLTGIEELQLPAPRTSYAENHYWAYGVVLAKECPLDAEGFAAKLAVEKIGTRPFFWPIHEQPVLRSMGFFAGETYPVAERIARRGFYLPSGVAISEAQIERVASAVRSIILAGA